MTNQDYSNRKYKIVDYNPNWLQKFNEFAKELHNEFKEDAIRIEHIGSTSVPGMEGKPIIDILVVVENLVIIEKHISSMENLGYEFVGQYLKESSRLFRKLNNGEITVNIQVFETSSQTVEEILQLRNYLRAHPNEVKEYSQLKRTLFENYSDDYSNYRKLKNEYMAGLKDRAKIYFGKSNSRQ